MATLTSMLDRSFLALASRGSRLSILKKLSASDVADAMAAFGP